MTDKEAIEILWEELKLANSDGNVLLSLALSIGIHAIKERGCKD